MNQPDFAKLAGTTKKTLIEWEAGRTSPTAVQLAGLSSSADVDVLYILTGNRTPEQLMKRSAALRKLANEIGDPALSAAFMETDKAITEQHIKRSPRYEHLHDILDHCTDDTVELLIQVAQKMIGR